MFFIRLFLANTWEKNRGTPCLFPHKLLWKVDMVLRSQSGWTICRGVGEWGEIQNNVHRVKSVHLRSTLFSVVFMWLISPTQKFKLEKSTLNTNKWAPTFCLIPVSWGSMFCFRFRCVLKVYTLSKILLWIKPSYFSLENACYSWCMHQTGLFSSASVVPQSKFTGELWSSASVVPQSKSTELCS